MFLLWIPFWAALISIGYDIYTYEKRQTAWEKAHPGKMYIRNYHKLMADD